MGLPDPPPALPSPHTSAMIFSSSRFSFSNSRDFSSSLLLVEDPVFMVSCASDCHSPRVISLRIWGWRLGAWMAEQGQCQCLADGGLQLKRTKTRGTSWARNKG